tara:strand:- start:38 stop:550 length:513 start_codon:yes stop_codon:yes gene_type:complete
MPRKKETIDYFRAIQALNELHSEIVNTSTNPQNPDREVLQGRVDGMVRLQAKLAVIPRTDVERAALKFGALFEKLLKNDIQRMQLERDIRIEQRAYENSTGSFKGLFKFLAATAIGADGYIKRVSTDSKNINRKIQKREMLLENSINLSDQLKVQEETLEEIFFNKASIT